MARMRCPIVAKGFIRHCPVRECVATGECQHNKQIDLEAASELCVVGKDGALIVGNLESLSTGKVILSLPKPFAPPKTKSGLD